MSTRSTSFFKRVFPFVLLVLPLLAGGLGSFFTSSSVDTLWYQNLAQAALSPPSWVFGPVWTLLYILLGLAVYVVAREYLRDNSPAQRIALLVFGVQLGLNVLWSALFFGLQDPVLALVGICLLLVSIIANIVLFGRIKKLAAWLLVPYLLWVGFATYLNVMIVLLN